MCIRDSIRTRGDPKIISNTNVKIHFWGSREGWTWQVWLEKIYIMHMLPCIVVHPDAQVEKEAEAAVVNNMRFMGSLCVFVRVVVCSRAILWQKLIV